MTVPSLFMFVLDPIAGIALAAIVGSFLIRVMLRKHAILRLLVQVAFLVVLTIILFGEGIVPYAMAPVVTGLPQQVFTDIAKIVWWINAAWALAGLVRMFLIIKQPHAGRLIQDLVIGMIYLGAGLSIVAYVFSVPVGTLVATSGVVAIIVGLALQSTLGDVFSGIALNIGRPYSVGDWIVLNDTIEGRVLEANWRATHLLNGFNDLVVLPNSSLAKATITNMSSPEHSHGVKLRVSFRPSRTPSEILDAMRNVLLSCNTVLKSPPPTVQVKALTATAIEIELSFRVPDISNSTPARNEIFDLIYRHALAVGLRLAQAPDVPVFRADVPPHEAGPDQSERGTHRTTAQRLLDKIPLFASLTEDEKEALAGTMTRRTYRKGEIVAEHGTVLHSLTILREGVLIVTHRDNDHDVELGRLAPGDFLGDGGLLTGAPEVGTIRALTFVVVYEIGHVGLAPLMQDRPRIAEELATIFANRRERGNHPALRDKTLAEPGSAQLILARIRDLFGVKHMDGI